MTDAAFVVLRELAELMLVYGAVLTLLGQHQRRELARAIAPGAVAGFGLGALSSALLSQSLLGGPGEALATLALGVMTLWLSLSMLHSTRSITAHVEGRLLDVLEGRHAFAAVFGFCALASLRETLELGVFLGAEVQREGDVAVIAGAAIGAVGALLAGFAFRSMWTRLRLGIVYRVSTLLLCFISVELLLDATVALILRMSSTSSWVALMQAELTGRELPFAAVALLVTGLPALWLLLRWWRESTFDRVGP